MIDIEKINLTDIKEADYNPRKISDNEFIKLKNSLKEFGLVEPILINLKNNTIIGGHQRYKAIVDECMISNNFYKELNLIKLGGIGWVFDNENLTVKNDDYEKLLNLALNKIDGEWVDDEVEGIIDELILNGFDVGLTGFDIDLEEGEDITFNEDIEINGNNIDDFEPIFNSDEIIEDVITNFKKINIENFKIIFMDYGRAMYEFNKLVNGKNYGFFIPFLFNEKNVEELINLIDDEFIKNFAEWIVKEKENVPNFFNCDKLIKEFLEEFNDYNKLSPYDMQCLFKRFELDDKKVLSLEDDGAAVVGICSLLKNNRFYCYNPYYDFNKLVDFLKKSDYKTINNINGEYYDYIILNEPAEDNLKEILNNVLKNVDFDKCIVFSKKNIEKTIYDITYNNQTNFENILINNKSIYMINGRELN